MPLIIFYDDGGFTWKEQSCCSQSPAIVFSCLITQQYIFLSEATISVFVFGLFIHLLCIHWGKYIPTRKMLSVSSIVA